MPAQRTHVIRRFALGGCLANFGCSAGGDDVPTAPLPSAGGAPAASVGSTGSSGGLGAPSTGAIGNLDFPGATRAGPCLAGKYVGDFSCKYNDPTNPLIPADFAVTGPVTFTLEQSASGEFLEIRDGAIDGAALLFIAFTAPLEGRLDCGSKRFDAKLVNGTSLAGDFAGQLTGTLDPTTQKLSGEWTLSLVSAATGHCDGPWSVTRQQ